MELQYLVLELIFKVPGRTRANATFFFFFEISVVTHFSIIGQPTSSRRVYCVYYRTQCVTVAKFHAYCFRCQGLPYVHCWSDLIYFSLLLGRTATVPCQAEISLNLWSSGLLRRVASTYATHDTAHQPSELWILSSPPRIPQCRVKNMILWKVYIWVLFFGV